MARIETDPNYTTPTFSRATATTDPFKKEDVQNLAAAFSTHVHDGTGKGLAIAATGIPAGSITGAMIVDGTITSADIADGTITAADIADATITNAKLGPDVARANLLVNSGFEIWQRGNGPFTANGVYGPDRWRQDLTGSSTLSVSKASAGSSSVNAPNGALQGTYVHNAESFVTQYLVQADKADLLAGRTITFAMDVNASAANAVRLKLATNGTGALNVLSAFAAGDGAWHRLSVTALVPTDATTVTVGISLMASATFYLNDAMLVVGSQSATYAPMHPADDLARCLRYYEVVSDGAVDPLYPRLMGIASGAGQPSDTSLSYKVQKAVIPTVTKSGTWQVTNCGQPVQAGTPGVHGTTLEIASSAAGAFYANPNGAGSTLVSEANP